MMQQTALTVERVIEETVADVRSYYQGEALRALLTYSKGDAAKLNYAAGYIRKLLDVEHQQVQAVRGSVPTPVTAIK